MGLHRTRAAPGALVSVDRSAIDAALDLVREVTGADFREYRQAMLERRIAHHMVALGCAEGAEYLRLLRAHPDEVRLLVGRLTVKVSRFYRNAPAFDLLAARLPELARTLQGEPLRAWSAGTAHGQEAYTLAMLLADTGVPHAAVLATDLDETALAAGARGVYRAEDLAEIPPAVRARHLRESSDGAAHVVEALRRRVRFVRHDLAAGGAFSSFRFHLICCRNVLIYFSPPLQHRALRALAGALEPGGYLLLGEAEWPDDETLSRLELLDSSAKLFRARARGVREAA